MPNCNYMVRDKACGIEIEEAGKDKCYVHRCISQNEPIANWQKFKKFIEKHADIFFLPEDNPEAMIFDFEFNFKQFYGVVDKGDIQNLILENIFFKKKARFDRTGLSSGLDIVKCTFEKKASFRNFIFSDTTGGYARSIINNQIEMVNFKKGADFKNTKFINNTFKDTDLSKCIFYKAEFKNCNFVNIKWETKSSWLPLIGKINKRKTVLLDELNLKRKDPEYLENLSDLERIYRSLKALSKSAEDRDMEGEFNYSENEMIRKRNGLFKQLFTSKFWYFVGSRYGERPFYAFINIFAIIIFFSILFYFTDLRILDKTLLTSFYWKAAISHALSPFTFNKWPLTAPSGLLTLILSIFEGSIIAIQIGLFVNALRKKLYR